MESSGLNAKDIQIALNRICLFLLLLLIDNYFLGKAKIINECLQL